MRAADEADLLRQLADGSLPAAEFTHQNHVRAAWQCLREGPTLPAAAHRFGDLLLQYVRALGAQDKFHLTLTLAFMHIIHARMGADAESFATFAARNPDLFEDARSLIARHYSAARIASGRTRFAEPDHAPLP